MCGIAGELQFNGGFVPLTGVEKANKRQERRGPDGEGIFQHNQLAMGHRRLKIFDLSERASQPMIDYGLGLVLVFNGAIYNFQELRRELEAKGYRFESDCDTEVLLKAYHAWGDACVEKLRGMFAFAIWERESGKLTLARDRLGIKPLYYADTSKGFRFASTLPALLEFDGIDTSIDPDALHYYLTFHAVPEPLTLLSGINKLPPGSLLTVYANGRKEQKRYWDLTINEDSADYQRTEKEWLEATHNAMSVATSRQLAADVPVGILLSGGLDSSLLVALAAQPKDRQIETFSIGFESARGETGDEFYYSDMVASHFQTRHHKLFISNRRLADSLGDCVKAMSEPMTSHDNIGFYLLSNEVSKHVRVVLSGQGADEIFGGYHWFHNLGEPAASHSDASARLMRLLADHSYEEYQATVIPDYRTGNLAHGFLQQLCIENGSRNLAYPLLDYESTFALANGPLGRVDNMTMAYSLEARVPFLDEAVTSLARTMPLEYKLRDGGKYMLKQLGRQLLPHEVVDRPKGYFPVPALKYLQGPTLELMHEVLSPARVRERGIFDPGLVQQLLDAPHRHLTANGASKLWQIGLLEFWLQQQGL